VTVTVSQTHIGLESSSLTGFGLLLNWFDLHNFFSKLVFDSFFFVFFLQFSPEKIDNFEFLDGDTEFENFF